MFDLYCEICARTYLVGVRRLRRFENTDNGHVGEAACPHGHLTRVEFRRAPAARQSGQEQPEERQTA